MKRATTKIIDTVMPILASSIRWRSKKEKNRQMKNTNTNKVKPPQFKDVSRYTRWINRLDKLDENLNPAKRKTKWLFFMGTLFLSFALSFILFPAGKFRHEKLDGPALSTGQPAQKKPVTSPFEIPVDSFENLLKRHIHEDNLHVPEKE
jgi:hypothetical protein